MNSASPKLSRISSALVGNPRATLPAYLRYREVVLAAYAKHPAVYIYRPSNIACNTIVSRLRDAIRGALFFGYEDTIPLEDLRNWWGEVQVKTDGTHIYIGKQEHLVPILSGEEVGGSHRDAKYTYPTLTFEEVSAFQLLLSTNRISGPVIVKSSPDITLLPQRDNVEMVLKPDGSLIIL